MDPVLVLLSFFRVTEVNSLSSSGSNGFAVFDFATSTAQGYLAEKIPPVNEQKVDDGPVVPVKGHDVDVS